MPEGHESTVVNLLMGKVIRVNPRGVPSESIRKLRECFYRLVESSFALQFGQLAHHSARKMTLTRRVDVFG